jgi:hypothetical protein
MVLRIAAGLGIGLIALATMTGALLWLYTEFDFTM